MVYASEYFWIILRVSLKITLDNFKFNMTIQGIKRNKFRKKINKYFLNLIYIIIYITGCEIGRENMLIVNIT